MLCAQACGATPNVGQPRLGEAYAPQAGRLEDSVLAYTVTCPLPKRYYLDGVGRAALSETSHIGGLASAGCLGFTKMSILRPYVQLQAAR